MADINYGGSITLLQLFARLKSLLTGYLRTEKLQEAVDDALTQAKESGEFDGAPGHTPEKGVDYFTEDDKTEMVNAVLEALPAAEGVDF